MRILDEKRNALIEGLRILRDDKTRMYKGVRQLAAEEATKTPRFTFEKRKAVNDIQRVNRKSLNYLLAILRINERKADLEEALLYIWIGHEDLKSLVVYPLETIEEELQSIVKFPLKTIEEEDLQE